MAWCGVVWLGVFQLHLCISGIRKKLPEVVDRIVHWEQCRDCELERVKLQRAGKVFWWQQKARDDIELHEVAVSPASHTRQPSDSHTLQALTGTFHFVGAFCLYSRRFGVCH